MAKWPAAKIEDVAERVAMGPFGSTIKVDTFVPSGVPVISGQHLHGWKVHDSVGFNFVTEEHADRLKNANVQRGDIVFTHAGNIGQVAFIPDSSQFERYVISQRQFYLRCDRSKVIPEFVVAYFKTPEGRHQLLANTSQVGVPSIAQPVTYLRTIEIPLPPLPQQREIAHILGTLNDKIELNRRMSKELGEMARAIFQSWFVDFDPVRAKIESREEGSLSGFPVHLSGLFPARFEDSGKGEVPAGWGVVALRQLARIQGGRQLATGERASSGTYPVFGANGIMGYTEHPTESGFVIAFGRVGANCGSVHWTYQGAWINNNASAVVPERWPEFVLESMLSVDFESLRTGSAQPFIPNSSLSSLLVMRPPDAALDAFCSLVEPLRRKQAASEGESRVLAALRDVLLPKLISGAIRLKDAERLVESAV